MKKYLPVLLVLLLAFAWRTYQLTEIPPGLTHDEANHGRDAMNVLDGVLLFYFPLNYGSEPLYNYLVAGNMALLGERLLALRLVNVFFGLLAIAATYRWARRALDPATALLGAALLALSFWPLASSRQALRAGALPFLVAGSVLFFWALLCRAGRHAPPGWARPVWGAVAGLALCLAAALHTYLAARIWWLLFPLFLLYLALAHRPLFGRVWRPVVAGVIAAWLLTVPMFAYVQAHPEAETRLQMLDGPLLSLAQGDLAPLLNNAGRAALAFVVPGFGDQFLAYNIPGRPVLDQVTALFFLCGLVVCLGRWRRPAYAFLLLWFGVGIIPSLLTGPTANTTRNLGALSATYLLPAVGFVVLARWLERRAGLQRPALARLVVGLLLGGWLAWVGWGTARDYFVRWGHSPEVRAAYQHTLVEALATLVAEARDGPVVVSSVYPGAAHDPSIARVLLSGQTAGLRWVDARYALLFPGGQPSLAVVSSATPLHPALARLARPLQTVSLRPDDLDPAFTLYQLQVEGGWLPAGPASAPAGAMNFGDAVYLIGGRWLAENVRPGETAELLTAWRVVDPARVGPRVPPAFETEVVFFTHVYDPAGNIVAQRDALDAPSWGWQPGDVILQLHPVYVPLETAPGIYETAVGIYDRASGARLPALAAGGAVAGDQAIVVPLRVSLE
ncbi:MAG: hypothetical protein L0332_35380 [Chloroflexi bacterium]|nr:hypothetical protein [Chloroflexota bacterium]MCI0580928.1 hypothetical protein [Chloroflexota bacterium]MCI0644807.1 hypothetical protein [Chloroflexota bacterium]MCI0731982.1 hypothetical protein [Chloroflexota bacterium]